MGIYPNLPLRVSPEREVPGTTAKREETPPERREMRAPATSYVANLRVPETNKGNVIDIMG